MIRALVILVVFWVVDQAMAPFPSVPIVNAIFTANVGNVL